MRCFGFIEDEFWDCFVFFGDEKFWIELEKEIYFG